MFGHVEEGKVHIFFGKMGSGKTTGAVHEIIKFYKKGLPIWVNFPIQCLPERSYKLESPVWLCKDPADILHMRGGLFVLDEAYLTLNARNWKDLDPKVHQAFAMCRKLGMTVIVIAQSWKRIDLTIRELATTARMYEGSSWLGYKYNYTDYDVDEAGDIVKTRFEGQVDESDSRRGMALVGRAVYKAFDTDFLFAPLPQNVRKTWPRAYTGPGLVAKPPSPTGDRFQRLLAYVPRLPIPWKKKEGGGGQGPPPEGTEGPTAEIVDKPLTAR